MQQDQKGVEISNIVDYQQLARNGYLEQVRVVIDGLNQEALLALCELRACEGLTFLHSAAQNIDHGVSIIKYIKSKLGSQTESLFKLLDDCQWSVYHYAAEVDNAKIFEELLNDHTSDYLNSICQLRSDTGETVLDFACANNSENQAVLKYILKRLGPNIKELLEQPNSAGESIYHLLAKHTGLKTLELLLNTHTHHELMSICQLQSHTGNTILHYMAMNKEYGAEMIMYMRSKLQDQLVVFFEQRNDLRNTVYHMAAQHGNVKIIEAILGELNQLQLMHCFQLQNQTGKTLFHSAIRNKECGMEIIGYFQKKLACYPEDIPIHVDHQGYSVYHRAVAQGNVAIIKLLFDSRSVHEINVICQIKSLDGGTLLHSAAFNVNHGPEILAYLQLKLGNIMTTLLSQLDNKGCTVFHIAAIFGNVAILRQLFDKLDFDMILSICQFESFDRKTLLHFVLTNKKNGFELISYLQSLFDDKFDMLLNHQDIDGHNAYHQAVVTGNPQMLDKLLAPLNDTTVFSACQLKTIDGVTPLWLTLINKKYAAENILLLLNRLSGFGTELFKTKNLLGCNIYHYAAEYGNRSIVENLFENLGMYEVKLICEMRTVTNDTFLHLINRNAAHGADILAYIVKKLGKNIKSLLSQKNNSGETVYHVACLSHDKIMPMLLAELDYPEIVAICQLVDKVERTPLLNIIDNSNHRIKLIQCLIKKIGSELKNLLKQHYNVKLPSLFFISHRSDSETFYHRAIAQCEIAFVQTMFKNYDVSEMLSIIKLTSKRGNLMHTAVHNKLHNVEILQYFIEQLGDQAVDVISTRNHVGENLYHTAAHYGNLATIKLLFSGLNAESIEYICDYQTTRGETLMDLTNKNEVNGAEIASYISTLLPDLAAQREKYHESIFCVIS